MWVLPALGSAAFAGLTSVLAKCGIRKTDSTVATAIRTVVVLLMSFLMVLIVGSLGGIGHIGAKTWVFLILSGLATGASWLCYFRALQLGDVNHVVPIDKSSTILSILLAFLILQEPISWLKGICVVLIAAGTYLMIEKKKVPKRENQKDAGKTRKTAADKDADGVPDVTEVAVSETPSAPEGLAAETGSGAPDDEADAGAVLPSAVKPAATVTGGTAADTPAGAKHSRAWLLFACLSAVFAALTSILGKIGIEGVESNLGTMIRTAVVLVMSWLMVPVTGKCDKLRGIPGRELLFICLSGLATGGSWLCYYRALQLGPASVVVPIDKLSILVTVAFSCLILREKLSRRAALGLLLIVAGTLLMLVPV